MSDNRLSTAQPRDLQKKKPKTDLAEIKQYMEQHYHEPLSIKQLAEIANISPKYFVDLFKKTFGQSAMEFLTDLRINRAKRYLTESGGRLRDIAQQVGYSDEFYFSRKFKKEVGISPSEYAKHSIKRVAACSSSITGQLLALQVIPTAAPLDPKWTAYYYNDYRTQIKSHLKLSDPYTNAKFEANVHKLIQTRPDVIIGMDSLPASEQNQLKHIAPSLFVPTNHMNWRDQLMMIAQFLDKEQAAIQWIDHYQQRVEQAKQQMNHMLGQDRVIVLRIYGSHIYQYRNRGLDDVLYNDLQLHQAYKQRASSSLPLTLQELNELNPQRILIMICPESTSRAHWLSLQYSAAWGTLQAVRERKVYTISSEPWCEYSACAISRMLDEAQLLFTGNCPNRLQDHVHGEYRAT